MTPDLSPLRLLLVTLAGWVNRRQQEVINYLVEENRVLQEQLGGRRVRLTDDQRRRLAAKGQQLGRQVLRQAATIVTPDTILRWHRMLIARKVDIRAEAAGASRDYEGDPSAYRADGHREPRMGLQPDPGRVEEPRPLRRAKHDRQGAEGPWDSARAGRPSSWRTFLRAHWGVIAGADFFTTEVWTPRGLVTYYTLFVLDLESRRVLVVGSTPNPDAGFSRRRGTSRTPSMDS